MILTITPPAESKFEFAARAGTPHDYSPSSRATSTNLSFFNGPSLPALQICAPQNMSSHHRGLPLPAAMTLPDPSRGPPPLPPHLGQIPPAPAQWHGAEESMRNWLIAKAEEDKRLQEEEKTRQEELKLEQRKIEQSMLRDSVASGVPLHLVPMIFAGIGGTLGNAGIEMAQQYLAQLQQATSHQQHVPSVANSELHREPRLIGQPHPLVSQHTVPKTGSGAPGQTQSSQAQHASAYPSPAYQSPRSQSRTNMYGAPTSVLRVAQQSSLPRLTTNEAHVQQPPSAPIYHHGGQVQHGQHEPSPSPSLAFHHWQPPSNQAIPSGKDVQKTSPSLQSQAPGSEQPIISRKRKAQGAHQPAPPPSTVPHSSPVFSTTSSTSAKSRRNGNGRHRSPVSNRDYDPLERTNRRPKRHERSQSGSKDSGSHPGTPLNHEKQEPSPQAQRSMKQHKS